MWTGKIRFEPRIGAEVEIKYPEKNKQNNNKNNNKNKKKLRIQKYPDTCGRGLSVLFLNSYRNWV